MEESIHHAALSARVSGGGAPSPAAAAAAAAAAIKIGAMQLVIMHKTAQYYGIAFGLLIFLFVFAHACDVGLGGKDGRVGNSIIARIARTPVRLARKIGMWKIPFFNSMSHSLLVTLYFGINAILVFHDMKGHYKAPLNFAAKRCGWMAVCNLLLTAILSLKNTPLAPLTGFSYEKLHTLHRWAGRMVYIFATCHMSLQIVSFKYVHALAYLRTTQRFYGEIAYGFLTLSMFISLPFVRKRLYEAFYPLHMAIFVVIVILLSKHDLYDMKIIPLTAGCLWLCDRIARLPIWYGHMGRANIYPLPCGATRVVMKIGNVVPPSFSPGSHAFIGLQTLMFWQSHPFTISTVKEKGIEFTVKARRGFTRRLYEKAVAEPGVEVGIRYDGPYGQVPDFRKYAKVVLVAGGSGASFTVPAAVDLVAAGNLPGDIPRKVVFVWVVRDAKVFTWFQTELDKLRQSPNVDVHLFVTGSNLSEDAAGNSPPDLELGPEGKTEKVSAVLAEDVAELPRFAKGRPEIATIVRDAIREGGAEEKIFVAACGPGTMMSVTRNAVADALPLSGPSVKLYLEQFGW